MAILRIVNLTAQAARIHARASRSFASSAINQGPRTLATPLASTFIATPKPSQAELAEHYSKFLDGEDIYESNRSKVATHVTHYPVEEVLLESSRADTVLEQVQIQQQQQSNTLAARDAESNSFGNYNSNGNNVYFVDGRVALA